MHVARSDHQVGPLGSLQQARQIGRVMGEVGVHLQDQRGAAGEGAPEAGDVGGAESFLAWPVQDADVLVALGQPLGDLPGAVGRTVIDDQDVS